MEPKAYSLHIGVNHVDTSSLSYDDDWESELHSCEADALAMLQIAQDLDYECSKILLTKEATRANFFKAISYFQNEKLKSGDLLLITFAGHGGQVEDEDGDEEDGRDETWCFYDGHLLDDDLYELLKTFKKGIRILIISDSCHSGDILRDAEEERADETHLLFGNSGIKDLPGVKAAVQLISSCQEFEYSREDRSQGLFTSVLMEVWDEGNFDGNYIDLYDAIVSEMPFCNNQTPNHLIGGVGYETFSKEDSFKV